MPLRKGRSRKTIRHNISELLASSTFARGKSPRKRWQMAVAAAYRAAGRKQQP